MSAESVARGAATSVSGASMIVTRPSGNGGITVGLDAYISRLRTSVGPYEGKSSPTYELTPKIADREFPLDKADLALCEPLVRE
jgi:hypothetical protein